MKTPTQAMLWELARLSRFEIPLRLAAMCFFAMMCSLVSRDLGEGQNQVIRGIAVGMFLVTAPFSHAWLGELDSKSTGFCFRLGYVRPVSTILLVLVPLIFSVLTAVACYVIPAAFVSCLWNARLPLLGPALLIALVVQLTVAVVWSVTSYLSKIIGIVLLVAIIIGLAIYFAMRSESPEPLLFAISKPSYFEMSWQQYGFILATMFATTVATIFAVDRQRHGDDWEFLSIASRFSPKLDSSVHADSILRPFRNRLSAQCWYEWRQFGIKIVIAGVLTSLLVVLLLVMFNLIYPGRNANTVIWVIALLCSPILFQVIGVEGAVGLKHVHGTTRLSLFDATRCLSNDQVVLTKLMVIAGCSSAAWLCMATIAWIDLSLFGRGDNWATNHVVSQALAETLPKISAQLGVGGWIVGFCNMLLLFVSSSSALLAFSLWLPIYYRRIVGLALFVALHALLAVAAIINKWPMNLALTAYGYFLAGLILFVCFTSIWRSLQLGAMRASFFIAVSCLWAIYAVSTVLLYWKISPQLPFPIPTSGIFFGAALLIVPLATTAMAPLAYATHRNG